MRKVFTDNLPKRIYRGKECFDWNNCIGMEVNFIYKDIEGYVNILNYDSKKCRILIEYKNETFNISAHHFLECKIGNLLGIKTSKYKYEVGQIVNNLEILELTRYGDSKYKQKGYKYKCTKDGYIGESIEQSIVKGSGCPVCSNNLVVKGINDIATTDPDILPQIVNKEDAYSYSIGTKTEVKTCCLSCGYEKMMQPIMLKRHLFKCPRCGDGVSYPEKFIFCLLEQLNLDFIPQKLFSWSKRKLYDFYIPTLNLIIEVHGLQHYKFTGGNWKLLEQERKNDEIKQKLAMENGVQKYITLDCRESDMEWIKKQVLKSDLSVMYNLKSINWIKCHEKGCASKIKEACDLWNNFSNSANEISKKMKLSSGTVSRYLKQGNILGWCDYDVKKNISEAGKITGKSKGKPVDMYDENNEFLGSFESASELSRVSFDKFGINLIPSLISAVCRGKSKHHKGYTFKYKKGENINA